MSSDQEKSPQDRLNDISSILGADGMFGGVSRIIQQLGQLAEKGEQLKRATQADSSSNEGKVAGSFDYSVKFGTLKKEDTYKVAPEPKSPASSSTSEVRPSPTLQTREVEVELFEEVDHLLLVAEMPGVSEEGVELQFSDNGVQIRGTGRVARFSTYVKLPKQFHREDATITSNNGIVEIRLRLS